MIDPTLSGCINHPGVEAVGRCKQCNAPYCGTCEVRSGSGRFCSAACRDQYEQFAARAKELDKHPPRGGLLTRLRIFVFKFAGLVIGIGAVLFGLSYFNVPYGGPVARTILQFLGAQLGLY